MYIYYEQIIVEICIIYISVYNNTKEVSTTLEKVKYPTKIYVLLLFFNL